MLKRIPAFIWALAMTVIATTLATATVGLASPTRGLASATGGRASTATAYYALTLTAQLALSNNGKTVECLLTVRNSSATATLSPLVPLDTVAKLVSANERLSHNQTIWPVGRIGPGGTKTLHVFYRLRVKIGSVYKIVGKTYPLQFQLFDTRSPNRITFVGTPVTQKEQQ